MLGAAATVPIIAAGSMSGISAVGCPYGVTGPCYGRCGRFVDANGNGLCDLGGNTSTTTSSTSSDDSSSTDSSTDSTTETSSTSGNSHAASNDSTGDNNTTVTLDSDSGLTGSELDDGSNFHILPVTLILFGSYLFTYFLFKKGILRPQQHKRIWNLLVTFGYIGTGITGVLLTLMINMGISTAYNPGISYWHAEMAILMVVGTVIHIHIYQKPVKKMLKTLFGFKSTNKGNMNKKNNRVTGGTSK